MSTPSPLSASQGNFGRSSLRLVIAQYSARWFKQWIKRSKLKANPDTDSTTQPESCALDKPHSPENIELWTPGYWDCMADDGQWVPGGWVVIKTDGTEAFVLTDNLR